MAPSGSEASETSGAAREAERRRSDEGEGEGEGEGWGEGLRRGRRRGGRRTERRAALRVVEGEQLSRAVPHGEPRANLAHLR